MPASLTYSAILLFTVFVCFVFSFHPRIRFDRHFGAFLAASSAVAMPFLLWDAWFTARGVWWFDLDYTLGITLAGLPLEECLFFIFIPFACTFTYYCLDKFFRFQGWEAFNNLLVWVSLVVLSVYALLYSDRLYTLVTALVTIGTLIYLHFIAKVNWLTQASFVYAVLMLGFIPVNGALTGFVLGHAIVYYNPEEHIGWRLLSIPVEDAVYGYALHLWVLYFFKYFSGKFKSDHDANKQLQGRF